MTPFPTRPRRKRALPRGRRHHNSLRDVRMARPSSSHRQHPCRFAPLLLRFSRKIRPFWLGPARQSTAGPSPRLSRSKFWFRENFVSKCQALYQGLPAVLRLRNSDFKKNRRNVFRIGTYLRPKMNIRIGEHVRMIFQWTYVKSREKCMGLGVVPTFLGVWRRGGVRLSSACCRRAPPARLSLPLGCCWAGSGLLCLWVISPGQVVSTAVSVAGPARCELKFKSGWVLEAPGLSQ